MSVTINDAPLELKGYVYPDGSIRFLRLEQLYVSITYNDNRTLMKVRGWPVLAARPAGSLPDRFVVEDC